MTSYDNIFMTECPECKGYDVECDVCKGKRVVPTDQGEMVLEFLREFGQVPYHTHEQYSEHINLIFGESK